MISSNEGGLIRDISDTARWVAVYRARESERPDAVFRDPFARRLAGERGEQIANALPFGEKAAWSWTARTHLVDRMIGDEVRRGIDLVVNLAAGLDARPYRMDLPRSLKWVEVDLPQILDYKEAALSDVQPRCALEHVRLDLSDVAGRRELFDRLGRSARNALLVSEGLLVYLAADEVGALARDLAAPPAFERWIIDVINPPLLRLLQNQMGDLVAAAGAPYRFAPPEGPSFFSAFGWKPIQVESMLKTAARLKRLPFFLRLIALLPDSRGRGSQPWSAMCLLAKSS